jgi:hypothetical protein
MVSAFLASMGLSLSAKPIEINTKGLFIQAPKRKGQAFFGRIVKGLTLKG